ncbi:cell division protein FtsL [Alteromonas oceanisediminis]|uniref:cell division protein FtsL n=1 Tax=Alteromonas oceanisediminis TaxID=2836180 RepID=UPI001BDB0FC2|nr:cell division protein FtsL [Alteromonas oceanisediminis]MBT0585518.1 cell division protein FtsL [Alteromonas oceanisediminis]
MIRQTTTFNPVAIMLADATRHPLRVLLFLLVIGSAVGVILSAHMNRQVIIANEQLMQEKDRLDIEWRHLLLEQGALTEHNRIESLVKRDLDMRRPTPDDEIVVRLK